MALGPGTGIFKIWNFEISKFENPDFDFGKLSYRVGRPRSAEQLTACSLHI